MNHNLAHLHEALAEARQRMSKEDPMKAFELAMAIPEQVAQEQEANEDAEGILAEARRAIEAADGLDLEPHHDRLKEAEAALSAADGRQAAGIAESIRRSLVVEREAMDVVRRAIRQRATIEQRFQGFEDAEAWGTRLADIEADAEARRWTKPAVPWTPCPATLMRRSATGVKRSSCWTSSVKNGAN